MNRLCSSLILLASTAALAQFAPFPGDKPPAPPPPAPAPPGPAPVTTPDARAPAPVATTPSSNFGVVLSLQNIFQNPGLLSGFNGGVGVQFALSERLSLRPTLSLNRTTNVPAVVETTTTLPGGMTTTTRSFMRPVGPTSTFGLTLGGDLLYRLLESALAPYLGGGVWLNYSSQARVFRDDTQMDQITAVNDLTSTFGLGLRGVLGVGWRVHPNVALFAEYSLNLTIVTTQSANTSTEVTQMGMTSTINSASNTTEVFEFNTALSQGAALGLALFF
ncbi:MAG: PorT family protein [Myxococcaceae bacterium]|nr:PorT family protein [Myxococcaceae bacterium]